MTLTTTDRLAEFLRDPRLVAAFVEDNPTRSALGRVLRGEGGGP